MAARTIVLHDHDDHGILRWVLAGAIVLAAHLGVVATYLLVAPHLQQGAAVVPVIVDLSPMPVSPASPVDLAHGPEMVESTVPPPEPQVTPPPPEPLIDPTPPVPFKPLVALPEPPPPQPPEVKEERKEEKIEKPPERKIVQRQKPAPRTSAAPRSERHTADSPSSPSAGATSSAAIASWRDLVVAQLQRAKRYPSGPESRREEGVVTLSFSLGRNGNVLSRGIARSSGNSELDREVLEMVMRAQPFPAFPASMTQSQIALSVPVRFSLR